MGDPRRPHVQHQNKVAFKHNPSSKKTQKILATPNVGLCTKCHDIIEWRKKYRKYKPLTAPRKCQLCDQKRVNRAYHNICDQCALQTNTCAKCRESKSIVNPIITPEQEKEDIQLVKEALSRMNERQKRKFLRDISSKKDDEEEKKPAVNDEEESYWPEEEEIDFVKAAKFLRARQAANDAADDVSDEDGGERKAKKAGGDNKQTNADPKEKKEAAKKKEEEEEDDEEDEDEDDGEEDEDDDEEEEEEDNTKTRKK